MAVDGAVVGEGDGGTRVGDFVGGGRVAVIVGAGEGADDGTDVGCVEGGAVDPDGQSNLAFATGCWQAHALISFFLSRGTWHQS